MWKVTVKGLLAHKLRLGLTALAIVLGVTFISGTLVLTDTLHDTFTTLFGHVYQNVDFEVRGKAAFSGNDSNGNAVRNPVPASIADTVRRVPGVAYAEGSVTGYAQFVAPDGKAITTGGAPTLGFSFDPNSQLSALDVVAGAAPTSSDEVVMDDGTATKYHFVVGDHVRILLAGPPRTFLISGLVRFGTADNLAGATLAAFDLPTAQQLFGETGRYDSILILTRPGADKATVERSIAAVLPAGVEVVTGQTVASEQTASIDQALSFFSTALLVFAFIALFVGGFTIFNTFSILVGQRTKELALLRIVGASRRQVFRSVLLEAALVGLVASLVGLGLGVLGAVGIEALLKGFGITLPTGPLVFESHTVVAALVVGVGVTVISALSPARRAVRIPPVAALSDHVRSDLESSRRRIVVGGVIALAGVAALVVGLTLPAIQLVGLGAVAVFVGIGMLAPVVARPVAGLVGRPLAAGLGISGKLGRENSMRSPRRTAQTSSALDGRVGPGVHHRRLRCVVVQIGDQQCGRGRQRRLHHHQRRATAPGSFSNSVATEAAKVPGVDDVSTVYSGQFEIRRLTVGPYRRRRRPSGQHRHPAGGRRLRPTGTGRRGAAHRHHHGPDQASGGGLGGAGQVRRDREHHHANRRHLQAQRPARQLPGQRLSSSSPISTIRSRWPSSSASTRGRCHRPQHHHSTPAQDHLSRTCRSRPGPSSRKSQQQQVNQLLGLVYALLALAVVIALIGIVNTLMLSVFERTHEIGLLRAVGMKRRQIRAMIRSEAVILSIFGAIIGVLVGTALGTPLPPP
jgi:putative ABC transport system permease protein